MTSRERVLAAIAHKEPDRVPLDHGSMRSTGIMAIAYNRLKAHLGIGTLPRCWKRPTNSVATK
jgi:uroporphyrinogen decarboxylase